MSVVRLRGVCKTYPDGTVALHPLDLDVEVGVLGLLGPNGAGKTSLLSILVLELEPSGGTLEFFGEPESADNRPRLRQRIGFLAQDFEAPGDLSGREYLELSLLLRQTPLGRKARKLRCDRLLERVGLAAEAHRRVGGYSGGMVRRLGLAQSLVHAPELLVVDEPTAGLDPEERIRFRGLVSELGQEIAVLLSTHIVEDVEATCPEILVIDQGRQRFKGRSVELIRGPDAADGDTTAAVPAVEATQISAARLGDGGDLERGYRALLQDSRREAISG